MQKELGYKETKENKKQAKEVDAFAICAGSGAAIEEIMAHERDIRARQVQEIFLTHTRHKIRMKM